MLVVDPAYVKHLWKYARPVLSRAFERGMGDFTIESVERAIYSGLMLLWVAWADGRIIAAVTTEICQAPKLKLCVISCCGGCAMKRWLKFITAIEAYARAEGCDVVRVMGRRGWEKMLPGYEQPFIILDKSLKD